MKSVVLSLLVVFSLFLQAIGRDKEDPITNTKALEIIEIFRQDPLSAKGKAAASLIPTFAGESSEVVVQVEERNMPWLKMGLDMDIGSRLMAAYIAGSVKSQLTKKARKDDLVAGAEQVIESYQKMRKVNPALTVPSVDEWVKLKAEDKLAEYFNVKEPVKSAIK